MYRTNAALKQNKKGVKQAQIRLDNTLETLSVLNKAIFWAA